jgi:hypothetical protein
MLLAGTLRSLPRTIASVLLLGNSWHRTYCQRDQAHPVNDQTIRRVLEAAGVDFIDENGGGPGVRLMARQQKKS